MVPQEPWCVAQLDDTGRGMSGNILTVNGDCGKQQQHCAHSTVENSGDFQRFSFSQIQDIDFSYEFRIFIFEQ